MKGQLLFQYTKKEVTRQTITNQLYVELLKGFVQQK